MNTAEEAHEEAASHPKLAASDEVRTMGDQVCEITLTKDRRAAWR